MNEQAVGTVITADSGAIRATVILDGSNTAIPVWTGFSQVDVNDRVVVTTIGKETYVIGGKIQDDTGWYDYSTNGPIVTAAAGFSLTRSVARRIGDWVSLTVLGNLTTAIVVGSSGNTTDTVIGTLATQFKSTAPYVQMLAGVTPVVIGYVSGANLTIASTVPGGTLPVGTTILIGGMYLL